MTTERDRLFESFRTVLRESANMSPTTREGTEVIETDNSTTIRSRNKSTGLVLVHKVEHSELECSFSIDMYVDNGDGGRDNRFPSVYVTNPASIVDFPRYASLLMEGITRVFHAGGVEHVHE